jgi:hypothetical protein
MAEFAGFSNAGEPQIQWPLPKSAIAFEGRPLGVYNLAQKG